MSTHCADAIDINSIRISAFITENAHIIFTPLTEHTHADDKHVLRNSDTDVF
jgi:hypothetical protein